ncbi:hypothetical protein M9Y10_025765 [Tritrichomonas musculus]|uniref:Uncharacterized protein n=1 Tax=Tritrichomonas musculus TaxID=1915356 RepID=A0ABR2H9M5_9EUKA
MFNTADCDGKEFEMKGFIGNGMDGQAYYEVTASNDIFIGALMISKYDRIETTSYDNNKLRLYLREGFFYQIPEEDIKYVAGTNPFGYLFANQAYDIIPKPEACSYLSTPHNIRTDGIVIGSNIETHSFLLNDLGNNVTILGGEIQRIDEAEQEDRKDINKLQQIVKQEEKYGWTKWLSVALTGATLIGIGWKAGSWLWENCGTKILRRREPTPIIENLSEETASSSSAATNSSVESLTARPVEHGSMAGSPIPAIQINSQTDYEQSVRNIEDMFHRLIPDDDSNDLNESTDINDYKYFDLFTHIKPNKFTNLTIFRGVMRIGDFMKIGRITDDDRLDAFISISPKTVFRFYDDDGNDILIDGFTTNDESTWTNNHLVLGNVLKEHLNNNYVKLTNLQNYLKKEDILSTENITQELSITTYFVNGTTNDEDRRTNIANLDGDLCKILKKSSLIVKGSCNNDDISGEYLFDSEDVEYYHYKKGENTLSIYFFYYAGSFRYNDNYNVNLESVSYSYKPDVYDEYCIPNMNFIKDNYALKTDIPEIPTDLVNNETLTNALNEYRKKEDLIANVSKKVIQQLPITIGIYEPEGITMDFGGTSFITFHEGAHLIGNVPYTDYKFDIIYQTQETEERHGTIAHKYNIGGSCYLYWEEATGALYDYFGTYGVIITSAEYEGEVEYDDKLALKSECDEKYIVKNGDSTINGNLTVNGTFHASQTNTTITHYCPIEESINSINDFIVGAPVYMTGNVYKQVNNKWQASTETDTTDCICSVKTNGKWNEYVGICVKIDEVNKCVTFATHGDYLVKVTDTSCYGIGDEVFIDEGELKTLTGQTAITSKIHRTTVGVITAKINDTMLAVFKT